MQVQLTDQEIGTLLALVRREARFNGYGYHWFPDNRSQWPRKLKRLSVIARKLHAARDNEHGT